MKLYNYIHKSALHIAIQQKSIEIVKLLLFCDRYDVNQSSI